MKKLCIGLAMFFASLFTLPAQESESQPPRILGLFCDNCGLTELDVSGCTALKTLECYSNQLTSLDVSGCTALTSLDCYDNPLISLDVSNCISLWFLSGLVQKYSDVPTLTTLNASGSGIFNIGDIFAHLPALSNLNLKNCARLGTLEIKGTNNPELTSLDISGCTSLYSLHVNGVNIQSLDVSSCTNLQSVSFSETSLTSLDISGRTALTRLVCTDNPLTSLDVSGCTALEYLSCRNNQLTSLDVSGCIALTDLYCYNNQLTSLDVSKNTALTQLWCKNNQLTSLDVSQNTALKQLVCESNQLTSLDVSKNTSLELLYCNDNQLTGLDLSHNTALTKLRCGNNQLMSLDVSKNTVLGELYCDSNHIPLSVLYGIYNSRKSQWSSFSAFGQTDTIVLPVNQVLDLSSERLLGERLSIFKISPDTYTENDFLFSFLKLGSYQLRLENSAISEANFTYYISVENPEGYYTVSLATNNTAWGSVSQSGNGTYEEGEEVTITATAKTGYRFINWTKGSDVFSTEAIHTFIVMENFELVANFEKRADDVETFQINIAANDSSWGSVSQSGDGTYEKGTKVTVTATANEGYRFINWTKDGAEFSKDAVYTFAVTENLNLIANFEKKSGDAANENRDKDNFYVYTKDRNIILSEERGAVQVFNVTGQCVYSGKDTVIPVGKSGVYVVRVGANSHKVIVL